MRDLGGKETFNVYLLFFVKSEVEEKNPQCLSFCGILIAEKQIPVNCNRFFLWVLKY